MRSDSSLWFALFIVLFPAVSWGQVRCEVEGGGDDRDPLYLSSKADPSISVGLLKSVKVVAEVGQVIEDLAVNVRGSLLFEANAQDLPFYTRNIISIGSANRSTINPAVELFRPRMNPAGDGRILATALIANEVEVSELMLDCDQVSLDRSDHVEFDKILSHDGAFYPKAPALWLSLDRYQPDSSKIRVVANDTQHLPFVIERRLRGEELVLVRLQSTLGVVLRGWVNQRLLTTRPAFAVSNFGRLGSLVGHKGRARKLPPRTFFGPARVVAGAKVQSPQGKVWAVVASDSTFSTEWRCGQRLAQIWPPDLRSKTPMWVDKRSISLPAHRNPCTSERSP